ncbi:Triacylglycerol lipase 1 [Spatholobus suberectus]|nr:Triacylglycerol lipase 1 [Spatholobus suberectus]
MRKVSGGRNLTPESGSCDPLCSLDETSSQEFEDSYQPKTDLLKAVAILAAAATGAVAINHSWVATNQDLAMALLFVIGYAGIIFEESLAFNKSGVGLLMAVSLWVIRSIGIGFDFKSVTELVVIDMPLNLNIWMIHTAEGAQIQELLLTKSSKQPDIHHNYGFSVAEISTSIRVSKALFVPSAVSLAVPLALMSLTRYSSYTSKVSHKG